MWALDDLFHTPAVRNDIEGVDNQTDSYTTSCSVGSIPSLTRRPAPTLSTTTPLWYAPNVLARAAKREVVFAHVLEISLDEYRWTKNTQPFMKLFAYNFNPMCVLKIDSNRTFVESLLVPSLWNARVPLSVRNHETDGSPIPSDDVFLTNCDDLETYMEQVLAFGHPLLAPVLAPVSRSTTPYRVDWITERRGETRYFGDACISATFETIIESHANRDDDEEIDGVENAGEASNGDTATEERLACRGPDDSNNLIQFFGYSILLDLFQIWLLRSNRPGTSNNYSLIVTCFTPQRCAYWDEPTAHSFLQQIGLAKRFPAVPNDRDDSPDINVRFCPLWTA